MMSNLQIFLCMLNYCINISWIRLAKSILMSPNGTLKHFEKIACLT
jgi:hypothetical protein